MVATVANTSNPSAESDGDSEAQVRLDALRPVPRITIQAFCETAEISTLLEEARSDRRMAKAQLRVQQGGIQAACQHFAAAPTPNLVILESESRPSVLLAELEALAEHCDPGTKVVVIGHYNDVFLYREMMRRGISEYLVAPAELVDVLAMVSQIFHTPDADPLGRTIAFMGAKGGVGSSTVAHNVAWSISHLFSDEVVLADLDLAFGTANINFDVDPAQGAVEALASADRMDDALLDRLLAKCADHLSLLAAPSTLDRTYQFEPQAFATLIEAAQRTTPAVVIDLPHAWTDWTRAVLEQADEVVITAAPDLANLRNAKNLVDRLRVLRPNDSSPRIVLNQVGMPKRPEIPAGEFLDALDVTGAVQIAFDPHLFGTAANNGRMVGDTDAKHAANACFAELAHSLTKRSTTRTAKRSGPARLMDLLRRR